MRVVVNRLAALGQKTGIGHYTVELLRCLRAQAGEDEIEDFPQGWVSQVRETLARVRPHLEAPAGAGGNGGMDVGHSLRRSAAALLRPGLDWARSSSRVLMGHYFRRICSRRHYELYHEPNFIPLPCDRPTVATLHDLSVILYPHWHPRDRVAYFDRHFRPGLNRCVHFFTISEFGRQEVIRVLGIPPERVTRTYMGIRPGLAPMPADEVTRTLRQLHLPPRYLLYLGTIEPRKNLLVLLRAYCALPERVRADWPLVLVGGWGWNTTDVADYLHREARHRGVLHLGYLPEEHVAAVYNGARALVYPSLYEGFGLPPIEMMACGGAVLASTAGAITETVGRRAHLIDPADVDGWRDAMRRIVEDQDWWRGLRTGVTNVARPFTWERCAADTLRVYRQLGSGTVRYVAPEPEAAPLAA